MRVPEEPVCIDLFRQNPVFTSLHLKSPVHVHRLRSNHFCPSTMGPNGWSVATDSVQSRHHTISLKKAIHSYCKDRKTYQWNNLSTGTCINAIMNTLNSKIPFSNPTKSKDYSWPRINKDSNECRLLYCRFYLFKILLY